MKYFFFTYPNCERCEGLREYLKEMKISFQEYDLSLKESKAKIREFLTALKRDEKGAIIIPTLILQDEGEVKAVLNSRGEMEEWLKSKA